MQWLVHAPSTGLWVAEPHFRIRTTVSEGTPAVPIYDFHGREGAVVTAPCDGQVVRMHTTPTGIEGKRAVFSGEIQERIGA